MESWPVSDINVARYFVTRSAAASTSSTLIRARSWVAIPVGQLFVWQRRLWIQPRASRFPRATPTASAPSGKAAAASAGVAMRPEANRVTSSRTLASHNTQLLSRSFLRQFRHCYEVAATSGGVLNFTHQGADQVEAQPPNSRSSRGTSRSGVVASVNGLKGVPSSEISSRRSPSSSQTRTTTELAPECVAILTSNSSTATCNGRTMESSTPLASANRAKSSFNR